MNIIENTDEALDFLHSIHVRDRLIFELADALSSIALHEREFNGLEDWETMVVRMTEKARAAIAKAKGETA